MAYMEWTTKVVNPMQLTDEKTRESIVNEIVALVGSFFYPNAKKCITWMATSNPMLGGVSPEEMVRLGREKKLLEIVKDAIENNVGIL